MSFHETRFPTEISRGAQGGPERRTDVVVLGSGFEERNSRWANSRRSYNAGYGVKSLDDLNAVIAFFEERRGRLHGFRWRDHADLKSCAPSADPSPLDQAIGTGDGTATDFQLAKTYGSAYAPWAREIKKPVAGTVRVAPDMASGYASAYVDQLRADPELALKFDDVLLKNLNRIPTSGRLAIEIELKLKGAAKK